MGRIAGYKGILKNVPEDKKPIAAKLIEELTFMEKTLKKLKEQIETYGEVEEFNQGAQNFLRESPALKGYNTMVQRYSVMNRQLTDLMHKSVVAEDSNPVYDFIKDNE